MSMLILGSRLLLPLAATALSFTFSPASAFTVAPPAARRRQRFVGVRKVWYTLLTPGAENPWVKLYENCR